MCDYQIYDAGIYTGTKYLTNEVAYFLGAIYAANEKVEDCDNNIYWAAPVRHNSTYIIKSYLSEHFDYVREIATKVNGYTIMAENIKGTPFDSGKNDRLDGFSTFFKSTSLYNLIPEIPKLRKVLLNSAENIRKSFVLGVFDGRGSLDINKKILDIRCISLDCPLIEIKEFISEVITSLNIKCGYNESRDRKEGGEPRNPQLRIAKSSINNYMKNISFISPTKFWKAREIFEKKYDSVTITESSIFPGLRFLIGE